MAIYGSNRTVDISIDALLPMLGLVFPMLGVVFLTTSLRLPISRLAYISK